MKLFLIFCVLLAFVKADLVRDLNKFQRTLDSLPSGLLEDLPVALQERKEELECFIREFEKDVNNERINVNISKRKL
jgi:hypothetical protein